MAHHPDAFDMDDAQDDGDGVTCNRCGEDSLYWQRVTQADGRSEKSVLFEDGKPHVCKPNADDFDVVD